MIKLYKYKNIVLFEGEYLNGEKGGHGKLYHDEETLIYEGEYLNGKKHGIGKEYHRNGKLQFEGEYLYNFRRKGKLYIKNKLEYEGEF